MVGRAVAQPLSRPLRHQRRPMSPSESFFDSRSYDPRCPSLPTSVARLDELNSAENSGARAEQFLNGERVKRRAPRKARSPTRPQRENQMRRGRRKTQRLNPTLSCQRERRARKCPDVRSRHSNQWREGARPRGSLRSSSFGGFCQERTGSLKIVGAVFRQRQ